MLVALYHRHHPLFKKRLSLPMNLWCPVRYFSMGLSVEENRNDLYLTPVKQKASRRWWWGYLRQAHFITASKKGGVNLIGWNQTPVILIENSLRVKGILLLQEIYQVARQGPRFVFTNQTINANKDCFTNEIRCQYHVQFLIRPLLRVALPSLINDP
jgi:hypothetical protein